MFGSGTASFDGYEYVLDFSPSGGTANGNYLSGNVPVSWDFFVTSPSGSVNWSVYFTLTVQQGSNSFYPSYSGSGMIGPGINQEVFNNGAITLPSGGGNVTNYNFDLYLTSTNASFSATIPGGGTVDFNPASSTPEPASLLMLTGGGALLWFMKRKRGA